MFFQSDFSFQIVDGSDSSALWSPQQMRCPHHSVQAATCQKRPPQASQKKKKRDKLIAKEKGNSLKYFENVLLTLTMNCEKVSKIGQKEKSDSESHIFHFSSLKDLAPKSILHQMRISNYSRKVYQTYNFSTVR